MLNEIGAVIYTYQNLNDDCEFCEIIKHQDGNEYMVFRSELYGYSVLNLSTLQDFHYMPPELETFIWTAVSYNKDTRFFVFRQITSSGVIYWKNGIKRRARTLDTMK